MKVVLQCQNQDALRSALRRPATSQNNTGSQHPNRPRSVFRQNIARRVGPLLRRSFKLVSDVRDVCSALHPAVRSVEAVLYK